MVDETVHEYDAEGRLIRSVTTRAPLWTDLDQAEMYALAEHRATLCPRHGGPLTECQTSEAAGGPVFVPQSAVCRAQHELVSAQRSESGQDRAKEYGDALMWGLTRERG